MDNFGYIWEIANENITRLRRQKAAEEKYRKEKELFLKQIHFADLTDSERWTESDYDVRKKGDHVELFHKKTGESILEAFSEQEAWRDLREELYGS